MVPCRGGLSPRLPSAPALPAPCAPEPQARWGRLSALPEQGVALGMCQPLDDASQSLPEPRGAATKGTEGCPEARRGAATSSQASVMHRGWAGPCCSERQEEGQGIGPPALPGAWQPRFQPPMGVQEGEGLRSDLSAAVPAGLPGGERGRRWRRAPEPPGNGPGAATERGQGRNPGTRALRSILLTSEYVKLGIAAPKIQSLPEVPVSTCNRFKKSTVTTARSPPARVRAGTGQVQDGHAAFLAGHGGL